MSAPAASRGIVSIGTKGNYRPDHKRLASSQVARARAELRMSPAEFASHLSGLLGWSVSPATVERWERESTPPGDVVSACYAITHGDPGADVPLLAAVPPAFPAEALAGPWVTCYQFSHDGQPRFHADIAHVAIGPDRRVRAVNHPPEPRSEGRPRPFRNEIDAQLAGRHLIGEWCNTSDTRYYGALQLAVLPGEIVMEGWYAGVGSDVEVSTGFWRWVRLDPDEGLAGITLREPSELHDLVRSHSQYGAPLTLADVRGDLPVGGISKQYVQDIIIDVYIKAWETRDPDLICTIFTPSATYHERVMGDPIPGRAAIRRYWETKVVGAQANITCRPLSLYVDGDTAIVEWLAEFDDLAQGVRKRMKEIAVLEFEWTMERGYLISSLREYWASEVVATVTATDRPEVYPLT